MKIAAGVIVGLLTSALAASEAELTSLVAQDLREPVRPGGVNGQAFCNMNALTFMYPPSFDLPKTEGADYYRFRVIGSARWSPSSCSSRPTIDSGSGHCRRGGEICHRGGVSSERFKGRSFQSIVDVKILTKSLP